MARVSQGLETFGSDRDPPVKSNAYTLKSSDATYTTPLATAGEDTMASPSRVLPQDSSGAGVQSVQVIVIGPDVHYAVSHRRRGLERRNSPGMSTVLLPYRRPTRTRYRHTLGPDVDHTVGHCRRRTLDRPCRTSTRVLPCWRSGRTGHRTRRTPRRWPPPAKSRLRSPSRSSTRAHRCRRSRHTRYCPKIRRRLPRRPPSATL